MTYKEFKRELYTNVLRKNKTFGKTIRLLERECICADRDAARILAACNSVLYGRSDGYVREEILCIAWEGQEHMHILYWPVPGLYKCFLKEGWQAVLPDIFMKLQAYGGRMGTERTQKNTDILERLFIRPMNYRQNREELKNAVYWRLGDIALVLHSFLYESGEDCMSMKCSRDTVRQAGLPEEVVLVNALLQTGAMFPPRLYHSDDIRRYLGGGGGVFMPDEKGERFFINRKDREEGMLGYRLTNTRYAGGAIAFFYPGVQERLAELIKGDYYVGFVSVHEAVIHPVRHKSLQEMKTSIERIHTLLDRQDALTTRVYYYSCSRERLFDV